MATKPLEPVLIVPDTHAPYHDERAWRLMMKAAKVVQPRHVVCMGDLADCFTISRHSKNPLRHGQLEDELAIVREKRQELDALEPTGRKIFIEGNHEDRLRRYIEERAPELYTLLDTDRALALTDNDWEFVPYKHHTKLGKVYFTHDTGHSGKYAVYRSLDAFQHSVVTCHTHRLAYLVEGDATGAQLVSASFGWLGDVEQVDYMHTISAKRNWALGFGLGYLNPATGLLYLQPVPIVDYSVVVNGKLIRS